MKKIFFLTLGLFWIGMGVESIIRTLPQHEPSGFFISLFWCFLSAFNINEAFKNKHEN